MTNLGFFILNYGNYRGVFVEIYVDFYHDKE